MLGEAPAQPAPTPAPTDEDGPQLLVLSARSEESLAAMTDDLAGWLDQDSTPSLADIAHTLQTGRSAFGHRACAVSARKTGDSLRGGTKAGLVQGKASAKPGLVFMYSGQGAQYPSMARELHTSYATFRDAFDESADLFESLIGQNLRTLVFADAADGQAAETLRQTQFTQPALFCVEYAMSRQLQAWGLQPTALLGHSIGEYAAICIAGVLSLEDAAQAVAARARLMQSMAPGAMLAVQLGAEALGMLPDDVEIAAINTAEATVVAGPFAAIDAFEVTLASRKVRYTRLQTSHAFHSAMMAPLLAQFRSVLASLDFRAPIIPIASNVTGQWLSDDEATSPDFWCEQIRRPVRFRDSTATVIAANPVTTFVEVGPGRALAGFVRECIAARSADAERSAPTSLTVAHTVRHPQDTRADATVLLEAVGRAWVSGVDVKWSAMHQAGRRRVALPTYRFLRQRHWSPSVRHLLARPVGAHAANDVGPKGTGPGAASAPVQVFREQSRH